MSRFSNVPSVRYNRSKFDISHGVKTTMSVGKLYPIKCVEVLPGDSFKSVMKAISRCTSSFLKPIIDELFMDVHSFFVPFRLLYDKSENVFGNPNPSAYIDNELEEYPSLPVSEVTPGTVGDYLGLPVSLGADGKTYIKKGCSILPFRAFAKIYNDWYRNENTVDEIYIQKGEFANSENLNNNEWSPNNYTGKLPNVSKKKDYFTACLPNTQKGASVPLPLGDFAPVITDTAILTRTYPQPPILFGQASNGLPYTGGSRNAIFGYLGGEDGNRLMLDEGSTTSQTNADSMTPLNLVADLSNATASDVATLRTAFQLQKMLEKDARYGSRYNEFLLGHFGVTSSDARLQFSEYLGGGRIPIGMQQVSQTSAPTEDSPLGALGANSHSFGFYRYSKGFTEHGYVITVACIKQLHTYQQGIPRMFFRKKREDFYDPLLANISEQPVYKTQLFGYATSENDDTTLTDTPFGYNEAWADYRYEPSIITGQLRSGIPNSLDIWHLADYFNSAPTLSKEFTEENSANIDRVLTVETSSQDNFLLDVWFDVSAIRVMPVYSVPGLVDHH